MRKVLYLTAVLITFFTAPLYFLPPGVSIPAASPSSPYLEVYNEENGLIYYSYPPGERTRSSPTLDISVYIPGTYIESRNLSSWGGYSIGVVGEEITFYTRAINHGELPAYNVSASLIIYIWNGAGRVDAGKVVWSQKYEIYVPPGDGTLSAPVSFKWTPSVAGPYIVNITFELKGDSRPRDNSAYYLGAMYMVGGMRRYSGVWVDRWIDSLEGETEIAAIPSESWSRVAMPALPTTGEHSPPTVFYSGSTSNLSSNYEPGARRLILPPFDLRYLPDNYFDPLFLQNRPQVYLGYKFLGEVDAGGKLVNLVSVDGGPFEPLLDPLGNPVVIDENTSEGGTFHWRYPTHLDIFGNSFYPGIDLSRYAGHWVRVALEYRPGQRENGSEMGYFLDDFLIFLRETYESFSISVSPSGPLEVELNPGGVTEVSFTVHFMRVKESLPLKVSTRCNCAGIDATVQPEVIREPEEGESREVVVSFTSDSRVSPGDYTAEVFFLGGGIALERIINLTVPEVESVSSEGGGTIEAPMQGSINLTAHLYNGGNVVLHMKSHLYLPDGFSASYQRELSLDPAEEIGLVASLNYDTRPPGNYSLTWLFYPSDMPGMEIMGVGEALETLNESGRAFCRVEYHVVISRTQSLYLKVLSHSLLIRYEGGSFKAELPYILSNRGNALENVTLHVDIDQLSDEYLNFTAVNVSVPPGEVVESVVEFHVNNTLMHGVYQARLYAVSERGEVVSEDTFELKVLNIMLASTLYSSEYVNLRMVPEEVIRGRESLLVINVTPRYSLSPDLLRLGVKIYMEDSLYAEKMWTLTDTNGALLKWFVTFRNAGRATVLLNVTWIVDGETFSFNTPPLRVRVHRVNIKVVDMVLVSEEGKKLSLEGSIKEGRYTLGAIITNTGDSEVKGLQLLFTYKCSGILKNFTVNVTLLKPGERRLITTGEVEIKKCGGEKVIVSVHIDPDATLPEENLQDNVMQRRVSVVEGKETPGLDPTRYAYFILVVIIITLMVSITVGMVKRIVEE